LIKNIHSWKNKNNNKTKIYIDIYIRIKEERIAVVQKIKKQYKTIGY
jgi:hypothetical protein